ncbi:hypothetical protein AVEN_247717-1 [Araneus ventricosus]|uniref:Tc1-like transposase DDE domain-containing protein n=1 Tax=Araneus ventricosus TaxID=182803 RepID=A0A4Y2GLQ3_ARAVE|nr:hypothetical protein AVEN_247717-1 [Araneus ventricosus]
MKAGSALVSAMAVCWLEGGQYLVVNRRTLTANLWVSLVIRPAMLPFMSSIKEGVLQQDKALTHNAVVTQHALQSVDMLPWPSRSPDLSTTENVWKNIG